MCNSIEEVLVVEDNALNIRIMEKLLTEMSLKVRLATNGEEALLELERSTPDLVLLDLAMPVMSGYDAIGKIRQNDRFKDLKIVALTASIRDDQREQILKLGFDQVLLKPLTLDMLRDFFREELGFSPA